MSTPVTQEQRSHIITSIKEGTPIAQAAEAHGVAAKTIATWMRNSNGHVRISLTETNKLKKEIEFLKHVILDLVLEQKAIVRKN